MPYQVGIDLGTTHAMAAVCRSGGAAEVVPLDRRGGAVPAALYLGADGAFLVGEAAERRALSDPGRVVRELTRRVGDPTPVLVGRTPVPGDELAARFVARLVEDVARREGGVAARVAVTHPVGWGAHKVGSLRAALAGQGLASAVLVAEPRAAVAGYASGGRLPVGGLVAVYDLGGGSFDASVVRRTPSGVELVGTPEGVERLGGVDFDELVFEHVRDALGPAWEDLDPADPEVLAAVADLRRECTAAKEALSQDTEVLVRVALPGVRTEVRLGRAEFEERIRPAVAETVEATRRVIDSAGVAPADLAALLLVGGSSRIPLVVQMVSAAFGRGVAVDVDPKAVVALGAALLARGGPAPRAPQAVSPRPAGAERRPAPAGAPAPARPAPAGRLPAPAAAAVRGPVTLPALVPVPAEEGTELLQAPRPPKQARPFAAGIATPQRPRRVALVASLGALALVALGGAVAFGAGGFGARTEAGATPPTSVVESPAPSAGNLPLETEGRRQVAPPPGGNRGAGRPAGAAVPKAPVSTPAATTSAPPPTSTTPPVTTAPPSETSDPAPTETEAPAGSVPPADDDAAAGGGGAEGQVDPAGAGTGGTVVAAPGAGDAGAGTDPADGG
jgi:actin-like ATPase involved in cell morphogenesis